MRSGLQQYTIALQTMAPLFVGSGKSIGKKEYIFVPREQKVYIPDMEKMFRFFQVHGLTAKYEDYLLYDRRDFAVWLREVGVSQDLYKTWIAYTIDSGDAVIEQRGKKEIATFMKDPYGCPYIPGSSLKGALRTILLSAEILQMGKPLQPLKEKVLRANLKLNRKKILQREIKQLESRVFNTLNREDQLENAVNDVLCGLRVGDSAPLDQRDLVLCQKIDVGVDGQQRKLPILRECICPGTEIRFPLTIDTTYCPYTPEDIMQAICSFVDNYITCFRSKFPIQTMPRGLSKEDTLYLGGGCGYATKTVVYPLLGKGGTRRVSEVIGSTLSRRASQEHKHWKDVSLGVSPHTLKCTQYHNALYEMGACRIQIL